MDLTFILTEACNLRCTYCYQPRYPESELPVATAVAAIDSAIAHGAERLSLTFFGGEPLLKAENLFAILAAAREREHRHRVPMTAKVSTNGLLLDGAVIARAAELGLFISLSCDGIPAAQDAGRPRHGGGASAEAATAALARLVAARRPFAVYSVVTPRNLRHLAASRRWLWQAGARVLVTAIDYTARWDREALERLRAQLREVGDFYRELLLDHREVHLEPYDSRIAQRTRSEWLRCSPGITQLTVAPDGALYGCLEYFHRRILPLGTAWDWLDAAAVRTMSKARSHRPEDCGGCGVRDRCNNTCACVNLRATSSPAQPPEALCLTEQQTLAEVDAWAGDMYRRRQSDFLLRHYSASHAMLSGIERWLESLDAAPIGSRP